MAYVATTNTTDKVILSDTETPSDGNFGIYLNGEKQRWTERQPPIVELSTGDDESTSIQIGMNVLQIQITGNTFAKDGSDGNWERFVSARAYWSAAANNSLLYLQILDKDDYNIAKWGNPVAQIRCRIVNFIADTSIESHYRFNVTIQRYTE